MANVYTINADQSYHGARVEIVVRGDNERNYEAKRFHRCVSNDRNHCISGYGRKPQKKKKKLFTQHYSMYVRLADVVKGRNLGEFLGLRVSD